MAANIHVGDVGMVFERTFKDQDGNPVDISSATVKQIIFRLENGPVKVKNATFTTDGHDAKLKYVGVAGDIDRAGLWGWQMYVELSPTQKFHTDALQFRVDGNYN